MQIYEKVNCKNLERVLFMNTEILENIKGIQKIVLEAYTMICRRALMLQKSDEIDCAKIAQILDELSCQFEKSTVALRNLCEKARPNVETGFKKPPLPTIKISGSVHVNEYGWLHITLNALLPHCRFQSPAYLTDTIIRLLDEYEHRGNDLPRFKEAVMVIDEHCDIDSRVIYDNDNKGYKAVSNAVKGRIIQDDDQFTLGIALISTRDKIPSCHVYLLPPDGLSDLFYLKYTDNSI